MRTDDFEDIKPQDTSDGTPDIVEVEEGDGFSEFDSPSNKGGKSLGELFRDNPIFKIVLIIIVVAGLVSAFLIFGGKGDAPKSEVGSAIQDREAPGQQTTEDYRNAVDEVNQQRLEQAQRNGESTIPIQTAGPDSTNVNGLNEEPPVTIDDPLKDYRFGAQTDGANQPIDPNALQPVLTNNPNQQNGQQQQQVAMGPDPAAVDALAIAMGEQMKGILGKHEIRSAQIIGVTDMKALREARAAALKNNSDTNGVGNGSDNVTAEEPPVEIIIPAGTIVYAQTLTEANSDVPGPVLARLASGPLAGSRILGTFDNADEYLTLNFNTVVVKGISQSVNAVALDPKTTLPAVATDIDHKYMTRFVLPAAASFIEGMGDAIAQSEQTVTVNNGTSSSSQSDLNTKQELASALADGTSKVGESLDQQASQAKIGVKVRSGTPIGILFLEPVVKEQ